MTSFAMTAGRRRSLSVVVLLWVVLWLVVGAVTGYQVRQLTQVSDSLVESADALDVAGIALQDIGRLPVVGERPEALGNQVRATAGDIDRAGAASRETVRTVSVLLGLALVLIPVVPVVAVYLPLRRAGSRERKTVKRALADGGQDPGLEEFLAHRAVQNLPYDTLREVSADPWGDLRRGSFRRLANAELTRLGLATRQRRIDHGTG
jgi:hypothetical protein